MKNLSLLSFKKAGRGHESPTEGIGKKLHACHHVPESECPIKCIPVATASVERSFSQMKLIKTRLRNRIGEKSLSYLMKIAIESPAKLTDEDLENIIDVWKRQPRRIIV